ncbi:alpha beta hydrolase family domain-containing [Fusarium albosuccineum]|uniref:Alpha beta hydrolase family domain-containing n=1 Tax=Fusarium albosuccineum TaxID=1237068 RepID=A0A8H4LF34_9HYPO|nr:alpha beta hydrolase family domain-containing [Fusarium albosuccineum]
MTASEALILIVGAWHTPQHYHKLVKQLEANGVRVICEQLPTNNNVVPPNTKIEDDVRFIKNMVAKEAAVGTQLTVIGHSWGGIVSSAALAEFAVKPGSGEGGVVDIIFMCAFIPSEKDSLAGLFGGQLPPYLTSLPNDTIVWTDPIDHLYNDLPTEEATWAEKTMVAHGHTAQYTSIDCQKVAWRVIPLTYIICENDQALPGFVQEMMIGKVEAEGIGVKQYRLPASHSPFLSMPDKVAEIVRDVMASR